MTGTFQKFRGLVSKNSPTILTYMACSGLISTALLAIKATPKALQIIEEEEYLREEQAFNEEDEKIDPEPITKKDIFMLTWREYFPAMTMGVVTMACMIGANSINEKRNAALVSVYSMTEKTLKEYRAKVAETIGEKKERTIRDEVTRERVKTNPVLADNITDTGKGDTLCYESLSGRYFKSDIEAIKRSENKLAYDQITEMSLSLNDVYYELGLRSTKLGDELGWPIANGQFEIDYSSQLTGDGTPCLVIDYKIMPGLVW